MRTKMPSDMPPIQYKYPEFIKALEARRAWAKKLDAKRLKEHKAEAKSFTEDFKARCREALTWTPEQVCAQYGELRVSHRSDTPSCPISIESKLDFIINAYTRQSSARKLITIRPHGEHELAYWLLMFDETKEAEKALC